MSDPGDRPGNVVNHDAVSATGADLAAEDEEVILFISGFSFAAD
jgi:hypothetical protein